MAMQICGLQCKDCARDGVCNAGAECKDMKAATTAKEIVAKNRIE